MDFGKLADISQVNFALPADHPATARVLAVAAPLGYLKPKVFVGAPTWTNRDWLGSYYPAGTPDKELLHWYSRQFNTIELNTTHYRIPDEGTIERWREAVTPNFTFCPKLPQLISHELQLLRAQDATHAFCDSVAGLGEYLGMCFLQLSPNFGPHQLSILTRYLQAFPKNIQLALELRDWDWFKNGVAADELFEVMETHGVSSVLTDVAGRRDVLHLRLSTPVAFIRFNGYGLHPTDYTRIDDWVTRISAWLHAGLQTLYFFVHQEKVRHVPVLANYLIEQLNTRCGLQLEPVKPIPQPVQGSLF